jgi:hypothetical protein
MAKCGIIDNLYNFDKTGFIIGIINTLIVIIYTNRYDKAKSV